MELHHRVKMIDTLLEEATQKASALTHAMAAKERAEQGEDATHGAPLTEEEQALKYEQDLWEKAHMELTELRTVLDEIEQLELQRGVSQ
jgi:hypothetical protein